MRIVVKETHCPFCLCELVVAEGTVTCTDDCELSPDIPWHPETLSKLQPVIDWQARVTGTSPDLHKDTESTIR